MSFARNAKSILDVGSTALVTVAAAALLWTLYKTPDTKNAAAAARIEAVAGLRIEATKATKRIGSGSVALVEFTDFQCPYCAKHAHDTYPSIRRELVDQNKLTYVSFAFPLERLHPQARKASEAAVCAARQGRYWEMHDRLFSSQTWFKDIEILSQNAVALGLDKGRFESCLANEAAGAVAADIAEGERLKVTSTPVFFLGTIQSDGAIKLERRINGSIPFKDISTAIADIAKKG